MKNIISLPDQFELEPTTTLSASYSDQIMEGTLGIGRGRRIIAYNSSGSVLIPMASRTGEGLTYLTYSNHLKRYNIGYNRFIRISSVSEFYYDSFTPNIFDIFKTDGGSGIYSNLDALSSWALPDNGKIQLGYGDLYITTSLSSTVTNTGWLLSFPFQGKYSHLPRLRETPQMRVVGLFQEAQLSSDVTYEQTTRTQLSDPDEFSLEFISISMSNGSDVYGDLNSMIFGVNYGICLKTMLEVSGGVSSNGKFSFTDNSYLTNTKDTIYKAFFGIGNGFRGQPSFDRDLTNISGSFTNSRFSYWRSQGLIIRGFKYGLLNSSPRTTSAVWRVGKFGQFRDMLEQRQYTKFIDLTIKDKTKNITNKSGITPSPVTIKFLSGSLAYITASNQLTMNLHDSGIYDSEYSSRQPFFDSSS